MRIPRRKLKRKAFTLIELLTVIAIIAILVGLLFPAIKSSLQKAEIATAKTEIKTIESAIKAYYTEYGKLPVPDSDQGVCDIWYSDSSATCKQRDIIDILRAFDPGPGNPNNNNALNPRKIQFLDTPTRKGALDPTDKRTYLDPWGKLYYIKMDNNYNNLISYYTGVPCLDGCGTSGACAPCATEIIPGIVVIVSFGPNGKQDDPAARGSDDIVNYR